MMASQTTWIPTLLVGMLGVASPIMAQAPAKLEQVPVYAGASRQAEREAELASPTDEPGGYGGFALRASTVRVYRVAAAIEDVARFYQQRLAARELQPDAEWEPANPEDLSAGRASPVVCQLSTVDLGPTSEASDEVRAAYARLRPPYRLGVWLAGEQCSWTYRESEDGFTEFMIVLEDTEAFEIIAPEYHHETEIVISAQAWSTAEGMEAEAEEEPERAVPMPPPTEAELEVPLYPGARFDGTMSAQLSASDDEAWYYIFASSDPYEKVAAFYRERTGKQGMENEGGVLLVIRGEGLFPDLGVTIQPNVGTFAPSVRSVITVRKRR